MVSIRKWWLRAALAALVASGTLACPKGGSQGGGSTGAGGGGTGAGDTGSTAGGAGGTSGTGAGGGAGGTDTGKAK